jgi:uncharacterized RmlC-like cupin family protein
VKIIRGQSVSSATPQGVVGGGATVSRETCGAGGIYMAYYRVPPRGRSIPHYHVNCETAVYLVKGHARAYSGNDLSIVMEAEPGDLVYIPANEVHMVENPSESEWVEYVAARNAPEEVVVEVNVRATESRSVG